MGCMIHYNWGTIKHDLTPDKLFVEKRGVEHFIRDLFNIKYSAGPTSNLILNFFNEVYDAPIDMREQAGEHFRVSQLCDCMGLDVEDFLKKEDFWLCYDDEEVEDPDAE